MILDLLPFRLPLPGQLPNNILNGLLQWQRPPSPLNAAAARQLAFQLLHFLLQDGHLPLAPDPEA